MTDHGPASAALLAVLADIFPPGGQGGDRFDHRSISAEVRNHPELLAALEFLEVRKAATGWGAGALTRDSINRVGQWLRSVEDRDLDGRRLVRDPSGRYRVTLSRRDEVPSVSKLARPPLIIDDGPAGAALVAVLADVFPPGRQGGGRFDHRSISSEVRNHPELFAALEFLEVRKATTGWGAGALTRESINRVGQWLRLAEDRDLDGRRLVRDPSGRYRVALPRRDTVLPVSEAARPPLIIDDGPASAALLAVLADIFGQGGDQFDHRAISAEARVRPELFAALGFLEVRRSTTGWRTGTLSSDSQDRVKQWLRLVEGRGLDGRRLERVASGRYQVALPRRDRVPSVGDAAPPPPIIDDGPASAALLAVLADVFWPGRPAGNQFDHRTISVQARSRPELLAALEFLQVDTPATGRRAGALSEASRDRIKHWLRLVESRDLDGRRLERAPLGRYRIALLRQDELPLFC